MFRVYIVIGMVWCMTFLQGCGTNEDVVGTENIADWFEVKDKPGELNQLLYRIYKEYDLTIFVNDTLGMEERGIDAYGNPIIHTELFDLGYYIFGTYSDFENVQLSEDTLAMIKAVEVIEEKVIPYLPKSGEYRPRSLLLAGAINMLYSVWSYYGTYDIYYTQDVYYRSLKGVVCGELNRILEMDASELEWWAGRILAARIGEGITACYESDVKAFYAITDEGVSSGTYYNKKYTLGSSDAKLPCEEYSFLGWKCDEEVNDQYKVTYTQEEDLQEFVAAVYVYRGKEEQFMTKYQAYNKILRKFTLMKELVTRLENMIKNE